MGGVYRLLSSGASEDQVIQHLSKVETDLMGLPARNAEALRELERKLIKLNVSLREP